MQDGASIAGKKDLSPSSKSIFEKGANSVKNDRCLEKTLALFCVFRILLLAGKVFFEFTLLDTGPPPVLTLCLWVQNLSWINGCFIPVKLAFVAWERFGTTKNFPTDLLFEPLS